MKDNIELVIRVLVTPIFVVALLIGALVFLIQDAYEGSISNP